ncbi:uncharacterized protein B0P05DRAFT_550397 [Gilbertella persicaria]|uniref:uncharacterized protein n=1 Tax=Gilbertella persicaria TaxID=101096 RepID=UPI0022210111|nr:uncharacterized protein B0P05DRAFT_550397 [Gilbertella persicaria]KAI8070616.1 hypothetical protein B0P05DRAFT_550397 [Gilbertella persicaria]
MKRLSPSNCSVVLFHEQNETLADLVDLLYSVFPTVVYKTRKPDIVHELKKQQYENTFTLLLIDAESCGISNHDDCPDLLLHVVHLIKEGILLDVVPIVCSSDDTPAYMVKCLQEGAADFVLKPICKDVIKTLFLNVTRYHIQKKQKKLDHIQQLTESTKSEKMVNHTNSGKVWEKFKERLKGVFFQEHWLSKLIADYYTPKPCVKRSSMASMLEDRKDYLKSHICSWDFLPLDLSNKDLVQVVFMILNDILTRYDELTPLRVPSDDLYHFIFDICNSYHNTNPYHNFRHAVDVLQANYYFLCHIGALDPMCPDAFVRFEHQQTDKEKAMNEKVANMLKPLDMFALLMASIGHDVGHPGVNNHFMVSTCTPLAILYNDKSVLESFHAMSFFHLLKSHCFSQLTDLRSNPEYASFRKIVVNSILATDMSLHDDYVSRIKDQADRLESDKVDFTDEMEKILLCGALIKCADISNCARPFESAKRWALILAEEFSEQGDLEKELGLPVLPINERGKIPLADFQLSFKRLIALKLFKAVSHVNSGKAYCM